MTRPAVFRRLSAFMVLGMLGGCSMPAPEVVPQVAAETGPSALARTPADASRPFSVADPGPLQGRLLSADLLVTGDRTLAMKQRNAVARTRGVLAAVPLSLATVPVSGRSITVGAVDPATYRRFTPGRTAGTDAVWQRVAAGEVALGRDVGENLGQPLGASIVLGNDVGAPTVRVGAYASMTPRIDAVVNEPRGRQLGMRPDNAILVSTGPPRAAEVAEKIEAIVGGRAVVQRLSATVPTTGTVQTAGLTGGSVAQAVGSFGYRYFPDGSVEPDPRWVVSNIRTQRVPILGSVSCHRVLLPQLQGALAETERAGLAGSINPDDFGGCYVPRFIDRDPSRGLSLHTWGIAVDLNVGENPLGSAGRMDPRIVDIFGRWGFAWGGNWRRPDPMHFELAAL